MDWANVGSVCERGSGTSRSTSGWPFRLFGREATRPSITSTWHPKLPGTIGFGQAVGTQSMGSRKLSAPPRASRPRWSRAWRGPRPSIPSCAVLERTRREEEASVEIQAPVRPRWVEELVSLPYSDGLSTLRWGVKKMCVKSLRARAMLRLGSSLAARGVRACDPNLCWSRRVPCVREPTRSLRTLGAWGLPLGADPDALSSSESDRPATCVCGAWSIDQNEIDRRGAD